METERRRIDRSSAQGNVCVAFGKVAPRIGPIKDISNTGLAFEYMTEKKGERDVFPKIDIFLLDNDYKLPDIPCELVYDVEMDEDDSNPVFQSPLKTRRCGVKFQPMNREQYERLNAFIQEHFRQ